MSSDQRDHDKKVDEIIHNLMDGQWVGVHNNYSDYHFIRGDQYTRDNILADLSTPVDSILCGKKLQKAPKLGKSPKYGRGWLRIYTEEEWNDIHDTIPPPSICEKCMNIINTTEHSDVILTTTTYNRYYRFMKKEFLDAVNTRNG